MKKLINASVEPCFILMFLTPSFKSWPERRPRETAMWTEELAKFLIRLHRFPGSATLMEREEHIPHQRPIRTPSYRLAGGTGCLSSWSCSPSWSCSSGVPG